MDQNPATASNAANAQQAAPPMPGTQNVRKKSNAIGIIIVLLFLAATIITSAAYFFLVPQKAKTPQTQQTGTPSISTSPNETKFPPRAGQEQWTTYTDKNLKYTFAYPQSWELTSDSKNAAKFILTYKDTKYPGIIEGEFLSKGAFSQLGVISCPQPAQDEGHTCYSIKKTAASTAFFHFTLENFSPALGSVYITRPGGVGIWINVAQSNFDSYETVGLIVDTLIFPNDKLLTPSLHVCPDAWSTSKSTFTYQGVTFPVQQIDQDYIKKNCKQ